MMGDQAWCPRCESHGRFLTSAHVAQTWCVDRAGNFMSDTKEEGEVVSKPCKENSWLCATCGVEAVWEKPKYSSGRRFFKTTFKVEVLSEGPIPDDLSLSDIARHLDYSVTSYDQTEVEMDGTMAVEALGRHGMEPDLFDLDVHGCDLEVNDG